MLKRHKSLILALVVFGIAYVLAYQSSEPFFNNDETRHVMTGVYFRDMLHDMPFGHLRGYTINYYLQYPSLGLLVWPPLFYFLEGVAMSIFGTSIIVSKTMIALFAAMACVYLFRLVRLTHDATRAVVAILFFALAPLVFQLSHYVMLELPSLALCLAAIYHFISYLNADRRRDLIFAALFSALAALTRFESAYLVLLFLVFIIIRKRWNLLWRKDVLIVAALALVIVAPIYALSASQVGWLHFKSATETLSPSYPGFLSLKRFIFYPSLLPAQLGMIALIPALIGLVYGLTKPQRQHSWPYLAMIVTTYIIFTPIGEMDSRHTIYWIPAFAFFAADGIALVTRLFRQPRLYLPLSAAILAGVMWLTLAKPLLIVRGYEEAAQSVAAKTTTSPFCLFMGRLDGDFIYQLRRQDPQRRLWVLRADKILFGVLPAPQVAQQQMTASDDEILSTIFKYDPEFIVTEEPSPNQSIPEDDPDRIEYEQLVRTAIGNHPERFNLEKSIAVSSNDPQYKGMMLKVFKNIYRNANPEHRLDVDIETLRRSVQTDVP